MKTSNDSNKTTKLERYLLAGCYIYVALHLIRSLLF